MSSLRVSVVVPCHNYGRYLDRCLSSIVNQTRRPDEILVVDDNSSDCSHDTARSFEAQGVRYLFVNAKGPQAARKAGFNATSGDIVCFIDADDYISERYIELGLRQLEHDQSIALVYSDVEYHGWLTGRNSQPTSASLNNLYRHNCIHVGALVRRSAIESTDALTISIGDQHEDWHVWRKILCGGFTAVKQQAFYFYRKHDDNLSHARIEGVGGYDYFTAAGLAFETVTLGIVLSGDPVAWTMLQTFLETQTWCREQLHLLIVNCSDSPSLTASVKDWLAKSEYPSFQHVSLPQYRGGWIPMSASSRGIVAARSSQWLQNLQLLHQLSRLTPSHYLWTLQEDTLPPANACEALLRHFDSDTISVAGASARCTKTAYAWQTPGEYLPYGSGVEVVKGTSLACSILRAPLLKDLLTKQLSKLHPPECSLYQALAGEYKAKINWDVRLESNRTKLTTPPGVVAQSLHPVSTSTALSCQSFEAPSSNRIVRIADLVAAAKTPYLLVQAIECGGHKQYRLPRALNKSDIYAHLSERWRELSFDQTTAINTHTLLWGQEHPTIDQVLFRLPSGFIIFETGTIDRYDCLRSFLERRGMYNESCLTQPDRERPRFYHRRFWFKLSTNLLPDRSSGPGSTICHFTDTWLAESLDSGIDLSKLPTLDDAGLEDIMRLESRGSAR
jgi:hypothetical protein